jgi:hypothetical protein
VTATVAGDGSAILGAVVAAIALSAAVRDIYLRTLGRRRDRYRRLRRLGTEAQLEFFAAVLGEPPAIRRTIPKKDFLEYLGSDDPGYDPESSEVQTREVRRDLMECFFIDRDYYVQTISDSDETVLAYSVTSRARRFRPRLELPARPPLRSRWRIERRWRREGRKVLKVRLLSTRFADLDSPDPRRLNGVKFEAYSGARSYSYSEFHYMGAMGVYQDFVLLANYPTTYGPHGEGIRTLR